MKIEIKGIDYYLPATCEGSEVLQRDNPDWDIPKIIEKTGVATRYIAAQGETAVDLAFAAGEKLLKRLCGSKEIGILILVTQSPDYVLPSSACILQDRLGLSKSCMAFDVNLGCSGFIYALAMAGGMIESGVAPNCLILCADTYSKYIGRNDRTCRPIFSDGAAAILIEKGDSDRIGPFEFGTDGSGHERLIVRRSGARSADPCPDEFCRTRTLEMQGSDVFLFTMREVPLCVSKLLLHAGITVSDVDVFIFHQASKLVIDNLIRSMSLDKEKVYVNYETRGNTVSASIPIALQDALQEGKVKKGDLVMLIGFGVGLSWGATLIRWSEMS